MELGVLQNVIEIDSMNYGWDETYGRLRSRMRFVGDIVGPGLVFSGRDLYHSKFSVKRLGLQDPSALDYPWGLVFGIDRVPLVPWDEFNMYMFLATSPGIAPPPPLFSPPAGPTSGVTVMTHPPDLLSAANVKFRGELLSTDQPSVDAGFSYSKYEKKTWWILADTHVGYGGDFSASDLKMAVDDALSLGLSDFAIVLGDIVENNVAGVEPFRREMNRLPHDWTYVLGNHDVDGWWWDPPETCPLVMEPSWGYEIIGGIRFIWLSDEGDGDWSYDGGYARKMYISDEQNDWFKGLMDSDKDIPTVIMTHQGPCVTGDWQYDIPDFWDPALRAWLYDDLDDYNLVAWIHGHRHIWFFHPDFESLGFHRISVDSIDKNTVTNESMFMTVELEGDKTTLTFRFRDHAAKEWRTLYGQYELSFEVTGHVTGWVDTPTQTLTSPGVYEEDVFGLEPGVSYLVKAFASWSPTDVVFGDEVLFKMFKWDLLCCRVNYVADTGVYTIDEIYDHIGLPDMGWGMVFVKDGGVLQAFTSEDESSPKSKVLEYDFDVLPWDETVMGIFAEETEIHTALGYARMMLDHTGEFEDYSFKWDEDGIHSGDVVLNRDQRIVDVLVGGAPVLCYSRPFDDSFVETDLYGKRTLLFSGYVHEISDKDNLLDLKLTGLSKDLDRREEVVLLDNLDLTAPEPDQIQPLDCFVLLGYIFDHAFRLRDYYYPVMGSEWHEENDAPFVVTGNLLNAVVRFTYFLDMIMSPRLVEEGVFTDVHIFQPMSGASLDVYTEDISTTDDENIILDLRLGKKTGIGEYINKLRGYAYLPHDEVEWSPLRADRLKRLLGEELIFEEEDTLRFGQFVGSKKEISDIVEDYVARQSYDWSGEIELHGHHHHLAGYEPQGAVNIHHTRMGIHETFRIIGFEITPFKTVLNFTNKPRRRTEPAGSEFERVWDYMMAKNVFTALGKSVFEIWVDSLSAFDTDDIVEAKLVGEDGLDITDWFDVYQSSFKGYKFVDMKITTDDFVGNSAHLNPKNVVLRNAFGAIREYEFSNFFWKGLWCLDPDPLGTGTTHYRFRIFGNIGLMEDNYKYEIHPGYLVFGEISGGIGDPAAGGGKLGDPRGKEYLGP